MSSLTSSQNDDNSSSLFDNKHIWMWVLGGFFIFIIVGTLIALWVKKGRLSRAKPKTAIFNTNSRSKTRSVKI